MALRHEQRRVSVPSCSSRIWMSASNNRAPLRDTGLVFLIVRLAPGFGIVTTDAQACFDSQRFSRLHRAPGAPPGRGTAGGHDWSPVLLSKERALPASSG